MTRIIGLTGGIGSGKTTVANLFRKHGIPVYIADDAAKKILDKPETRESIATAFGNEILRDDRVDREKLAAVVFNDRKKLEQLNDIIHPAVKKDFAGWLEAHRNYPAVIKEAAILFESGTDKDCDAIITVVAPLEIRITRIMRRDNAMRESILKRIENQWPDADRIAKSDYVITNIELPETERQVNEILKKLHIF